jgi:hypothetical protein
MKIFLKNLKDFFKDFSRIFQEYFPKSNHKSSQKVGMCGLYYHVYTHFMVVI